MGTFCEMCAHKDKSFFDIANMPSRVAFNNAAEDSSKEEMKNTASEVAAAEVAAPSTTIVRGAPDD